MILEKPEEWIRKIIFVSNSKSEVRNLEAYILSDLDARNDSNSFNLHNGDGKFYGSGRLPGFKMSDKTKSKMSLAKLGDKNSFYGRKHTLDTKLRISAACKGYVHSECGKLLIGAAQKGKCKTEKHRKIISSNMKNRFSSSAIRETISGQNSPHFKGTIIIKNEITGESKEIFGGIKELRALGMLAGFYKFLATGKLHKGFSFTRTSPERPRDDRV